MIRPFITAAQIEEAVTDLANRINAFYQGNDIYAIAVLNGSFIFCADLIRKLNSEIDINFISASSYHATKSTGRVDLDISQLYARSFERDILIIEDIIDTGLTLRVLINALKERGAKSIKIAALLCKGKDAKIDVDFKGIEIEDKFVVGYGLDFNGKYRGLPYIGILGQ
jgi:hypoxanthine phosphoribosyltransferase